MVSGSLSSPSRGAFHLSLTVLVHYRSHEIFSLGGWSPQLPTGLHVSCGTPDRSPLPLSFPYGILTLSDGAFQHLRVGLRLCSWVVLYPARVSPPARFGLFPVRSPLLRESRLISSRQATEMFQFTCRPPHSLCIQEWVSRHHSGGVAPFGISRLVARMQLPLNVSPVSASFIGMTRQGIHRERCPA